MFYDYERICGQIGLQSSCNRRMMRDSMLLHKVVNGVIDCTFFTKFVCSRVSQRYSRVLSWFYPSGLHKSDLITRLQLVLTNWNPTWMDLTLIYFFLFGQTISK